MATTTSKSQLDLEAISGGRFLGSDQNLVTIAGKTEFNYPPGSATPSDGTFIALTASLQSFLASGTQEFQWQYLNTTTNAWTNFSGATSSVFNLNHDNAAWGTAASLRVRCFSRGYTAETIIVKNYAADSIFIYSIEVSAPVLLKDAPDAASDGVYSSITIQGKKTDSQGTVNFGYITVTKNTDTEAATATNTATSPYTLSPESTSAATQYTIKLYDSSVKTTLLDTQIIPVIFKSAPGSSTVVPVLSNSTHVFSTDYNGNISTYAGSGTDIRVYEGQNFLNYGTTSTGTTTMIPNPLLFGGYNKDSFSRSIAVSDSYIVLGSRENSLNAEDSGTVYVYNTSGQLLRTLTDPNPQPFDYYGWTVGISGNYIIVSATDKDVGINEDQGKIYIYYADSGTLVHTLLSPSIAPGYEYFGTNIAVSGNYLAVGVPEWGFENAFNEYQSSTGIVYIYDIPTGQLLGSLSNPTPKTNDRFGYSLAMYGSYLVVGAPYKDKLNIAGNIEYGDMGYAYLYDLSSNSNISSINPQFVLQPDTPDTAILFGYSVSVSDSYIAIAAPNKQGLFTAGSRGAVYVFNRSNGALLTKLESPTAQSYNNYYDNYAYHLTLNNNYLFVGADGYSNNITTLKGSGRVYRYDLSNNAQLTTINNPNTSNPEYDYFGYPIVVSSSGNYMVIGATGTEYPNTIYSTGSGKAYVYNNNLQLLTTITNPNSFPTTYDNELYGGFGDSVHVSDNYLAIKSLYDDPTSLVFLYNKNTLQLVNVLKDPDLFTPDESNTGFSGSSVYNQSAIDISNNYVIIGSYRASISQQEQLTGLAYIYSTATGELLHTLQKPLPRSNTDFFGTKVAISDQYALVSYSKDYSSTAVYVYNPQTGSLITTINRPTNPVPGIFGHSMCITKDRFIISELNSLVYKIHVFTTTGGFLYTINAYTLDPNSYWIGQGELISLDASDRYIALASWQYGNPNEAFSPGIVKVYSILTGTLLFTKSDPAYDAINQVGGSFGSSVSIDNNYLVVGSKDYSITNEYGTNIGRIYIYNIFGTLIRTINGHSNIAPNIDRFGWSVAVSENYVFTGTPGYTKDYIGRVFIDNILGSGQYLVTNLETENITANGNITANTGYISIGDHSNMLTTSNSAKVIYTLAGATLQNEPFTISLTQTLFKTKERSPINVAINGTAWSDTVANSYFTTNYNGIKVVGDRVTIYDNASAFASTKEWSGTAWIVSTVRLDGNLLVAGTVTADKIDTRNLTIKDANNNIIFSAGTPLSASNITPASGWLNSNISITSSGTLANAGGGQVTLPGIGLSTFRVGARGLSATGYPIESGLRNADTNTILVGAANMYRVAKINRSTGTVTDVGGFNTLSGGASIPGDMAAALNAIGNDHIVVVFSYDEPQGNRLNSGLDTAMYRCGASRAVFGSPNFKYRSAYILIGIPGVGEGNGFEAYAGDTDSSANSWCDVAFAIRNGNPIVSGTSATPRTIQDYGYTGALNATYGATIGTNLSGQITSSNSSTFIADAAIKSAQIESLTANKISATSLSAISATIGTLRTATTGARMEVYDNVIKVYDSNGTLRVKLGNLDL